MTNKLIGATVRATNRTYGLLPSQPYGPEETVAKIVNEYDMTIKTVEGNVYPNGGYLVVRFS